MDPFYQIAELIGDGELRELEIYNIPRLSKKALVTVFISEAKL